MILPLRVKSPARVLMVELVDSVIALESVCAELRLMDKVPPAKVMALPDAKVPVVDPLPICSVPALMVVAPV